MELWICKGKNLKNVDYFWKSWSALPVTPQKFFLGPTIGMNSGKEIWTQLSYLLHLLLHKSLSLENVSRYAEEEIIAQTEMSPGCVKAIVTQRVLKHSGWNFLAWSREVIPRINRIKLCNGKMRKYFNSLLGNRVYSDKKKKKKRWASASSMGNNCPSSPVLVLGWHQWQWIAKFWNMKCEQSTPSLSSIGGHWRCSWDGEMDHPTHSHDYYMFFQSQLFCLHWLCGLFAPCFLSWHSDMKK